MGTLVRPTKWRLKMTGNVRKIDEGCKRLLWMVSISVSDDWSVALLADLGRHALTPDRLLLPC